MQVVTPCPSLALIPKPEAHLLIVFLHHSQGVHGSHKPANIQAVDPVAALRCLLACGAAKGCLLALSALDGTCKPAT
eukprot:1162016-Pelagomonas_calceolata.AAC.13